MLMQFVKIITWTFKVILLFGIYLQSSLFFLIHYQFFQIPLVVISLAIVVALPQLVIHTDMLKILSNRPIDSLLFMNSTLLLLVWNSLNALYNATQNSVYEIRAYIKSKL